MPRRDWQRPEGLVLAIRDRIRPVPKAAGIPIRVAAAADGERVSRPAPVGVVRGAMDSAKRVG